MRRPLPRWPHLLAVVLVALAVYLLLVLARGFSARNGPPLQPWHRIVPQGELQASGPGAHATWRDVQDAEARVFADLRRQLALHPVPGAYRYESASILGPRNGARDWNRSYESIPANPRGGVLLLHGLTDSPYSMRHVAARYERAGYAVIVPRLPGHGTVPAGLIDVHWQDWRMVVRAAMRELRARAGAGRPLHIVGYSNGAALAVKYALDVADGSDPGAPRADRLVLLSPMIGVSGGARVARFLAPFGGLRYFEQSRWIDVLPEFNPYKYNSFPVNGAVQSAALTQALKAQLSRLHARGDDGGLPPVLAFQSVLDSTVSTADVVHALFDRLPANGSELVLFDINRASVLAPLLRPAATGYLDTLRADGPRRYRLTLVGNLAADTLQVGERSHAPGTRAARERALGMAFPPNVYSLSHVALPFPMDDALYGLAPGNDAYAGIHLGRWPCTASAARCWSRPTSCCGWAATRSSRTWRRASMPWSRRRVHRPAPRQAQGRCHGHPPLRDEGTARCSTSPLTPHDLRLTHAPPLGA